MNKQEAIETIKNIDTLNINDIAGQKVDMVIKNQVLDIISQIDEPQKVVVPKCVAEWLKEYRYANTLLKVLNAAEDERIVPSVVNDWILDNQRDFVVAWYDGYEIEQEKLYKVEFPTGQRLYKNHPNGSSTEQIVIKFAHHADKDGHFTNKELEEAGYGWVFDCKGVKVEEVE
ncbi:DUF1642 domain-containing protein [Streptococcus orisratti]|uniref:DUF1642 domain-containing protein n=1 Tax=Streptococcus orisratti TaxID=114652 RepID=UPI0029420032|nr:DUF1642 domain-containing protein [Streptococcus orisratti]